MHANYLSHSNHAKNALVHCSMDGKNNSVQCFQKNALIHFHRVSSQYASVQESAKFDAMAAVLAQFCVSYTAMEIEETRPAKT